jgi:hypothetical protein
MEDATPTLFDFEFEIRMQGAKSSEGDGRTAADIEREMSEAKRREMEGEPRGTE